MGERERENAGEENPRERQREGEREGGERGLEGGTAPSKSARMLQTVPQHGRWMPSPTDQRAPHGINMPRHRPFHCPTYAQSTY